MFHPRHSSPNISRASTPRSPNMGLIPKFPRGPPPASQMGLFNPAVPFVPPVATASTLVPWGSGAFTAPPQGQFCGPPHNFPQPASCLPNAQPYGQSAGTARIAIQGQDNKEDHHDSGWQGQKDLDNKSNNSSHMRYRSGSRSSDHSRRSSSDRSNVSPSGSVDPHLEHGRWRWSGAVLRDDRFDDDEHYFKHTDNSKGYRSGAILIDDRNTEMGDGSDREKYQGQNNREFGRDYTRQGYENNNRRSKDSYSRKEDLKDKMGGYREDSNRKESARRESSNDRSRYQENFGFKRGSRMEEFHKSKKWDNIMDRNDRPILRDDRDGPVLMDDRDESRPSSRSGAILLEDRDSFDRGYSRMDNRGRDRSRVENKLGNWGQGRGLDKCDVEPESSLNRKFNERGRGSRYHGRGIGHYFNMGDRDNDKSFHDWDRGFDDQKKEYGKDAGFDTSRGLNRRSRDLQSSQKPIEKLGKTETGRTGALLLEDRSDDMNDTSVEGTIGRSGALLLEDRQTNRPVNRGHFEQPGSYRGHSQRQRGGFSRQSRERSQNRLDVKRSRSRSLSVHSEHVKQEPAYSDLAPEPEPKRRRRVRPQTEETKRVMQCVRSSSDLVQEGTEEPYVEPVSAWVRCSAADLYFTKEPQSGNLQTTKRMRDLEDKFEHDLVQRSSRVKATQEPYKKDRKVVVNWKNCEKCCKKDHDHDSEHSSCSSSSSSSSSSDSESDQEEQWMEELKFKQQNPNGLHKEIWYNEPGELNYGPLCRCSIKARKSGIRHNKFPGEQAIPKCDINSNNMDKLFHYKITVSPVTNFLTKHPTVIMFDGHEYQFEGFSIFTHQKVPKLPSCQVIRFNIVYTIHMIEEPVPENFSVRSLDIFTQFMFDEILELVDIDWFGPGTSENCRIFHVMPRFSRPFPENGKEILSMNDMLMYLLKSAKPLLDPVELPNLLKLEQEEWRLFVDSFRHMVVTCPGKRPSSLRIDQLDKQDCHVEDLIKYPLIVHHGLRPALLSYAGDPVYKKKWRELMKFRHLLWSRTKVSAKDKEKLDEFESQLEKIRLQCTMKREVTVDISSEGFLLTGIRADMCQHAMLLPVLFGHIRFHNCLGELQKKLNYQFKDISLLQLALTHSSYKINYGTNPDHGRNSLSNCGFRQLEFGDTNIITQQSRKRGLSYLLRIMSQFGYKDEVRSEIPHNERLEYLGDAVVEFVTSTHLFYMFPQANEGDLTLYRGSLVQNAHLAILANKLHLHDYLLYAHGPDLCHDRNLRHAMANCFEALMGALFLDGGIEVADRVFSVTVFDEEDLRDIWLDLPKHPLAQDEPNGDRHWIEKSDLLKKLVNFENDIGYEFQHIRILAKAFTQRNVGYNNLTMGHNQRLEFLGDTIMQLICSDYLFRHFPEHHEGHLTLLRSCLVNNKTQATVTMELGMLDYVINVNTQKKDFQHTAQYLFSKQKEKADLLEALLGALYVDGGLEPCKVLCGVCFFPRLEDFILNQDWNDPKSQLQQCCLTLRGLDDENPDIPKYKVLWKSGPTNVRKYKVAVYFRSKRLAVGQGHSIQQAEMNAAETALSRSDGLFHKRFCPQTNKLPHVKTKQEKTNCDSEKTKSTSKPEKRPVPNIQKV